MKVKCVIAKVSYGKTKTLREFAVIEGMSSDIGLWKCFVPKEVGLAAEELCGYDCYMSVEIFTGRDYRVLARVTGFTID